MGRIAIVATSVLALVLAVAPPAAAGEIFNFSGKIAVAEWSLGSTHTFFVAAFDGKFQSPPGRAFAGKEVFVGGHEEFCMEEVDVFVIRDFFGWDTPDALTIDGKLTSASVDDAAIPVFLDEVYFDGCDDPDFDNPTFNPHEGVVTLSADWTGSGSLVRTRSSFAFDGGPDCKFSFRSSAASRPAAATASLSGASEINLGTAELAAAHIASARDMSMSIGNGCF